MRTIGKRWPVGIGPDRQALCSYCGVQWRRSQLHRDRSENLACPDCASGLDVVSLSEGNAELMRSQQPKEIGPVDGGFDTFESPPFPGFVSPTALVPVQTRWPTGRLSVPVNLWLRADSVYQTTPGRVAIWPDGSGFNHSMIARNATAQPSWQVSDATLRGLPTVSANGTNQFLLCSTYLGGAPMWAWIIFKLNSTPMSWLLQAGAHLVQASSGTGNLVFVTNSGFSAENTGTIIGAWARGILTFNISGTDSLLVKSTLVTQPSGGQSQSPAAYIFAQNNGSLPANASIAELLITSGPPTPAEIAAIEAYGIARYGGGLFA